MDWKDQFITKVEKEAKERVCWKADSDFFADNRGHFFENDVLICQAGYYFYVSDGKDETSFYAPDVNFKDLIKKRDALDYLNSKISKLKNTSPLFSLFSETVNCYEFEGGYVCFIKIRGNQLNQLIDIAISKQKYSLSEYRRMHPEEP